MRAAFWIKRYLLAAVPLFAVLAIVEYLKGSTAPADFLSAAAWAVIAAGIFVYSQFRRYRKGLECAACDAVGKNAKRP